MAVSIISILIALAGIPLYGYVTSTLWGWFVIPVFHVAPIGIVAGIGLSLFVHFITYRRNAATRPEVDSTSECLANAFTASIVLPIIVYAFGYGIHLFA